MGGYAGAEAVGKHELPASLDPLMSWHNVGTRARWPKNGLPEDPRVPRRRITSRDVRRLVPARDLTENSRAEGTAATGKEATTAVRAPDRRRSGRHQAPTTGASRAIGGAPRAELLHVLMLPDFDRVDAIG